MTKLRCIFGQLILVITLFYDVESTTKGADYAVTVTAYPENGRFKSGQLVPLQCTITPTPPFPVEYIWRSSTQNHNPTASFPSSAPFTTVLIKDNHPLYGHYYCHVLSASNRRRTTLAVGQVTISPTGILQPMGTSDNVFTPPGPLELEVELQPEDEELLNVLSSITYKWRHNYTELTDEVVNSRQESSGFMINNNSLTVARTSPEDAGVYSVKIDSFSILNFTSQNCANIVLVVVRNYAIFKEVELFANNSEVSTDIRVLNLKPSPLSFVMEEVSFINGEPFVIDTHIRIAQRHASLIRNPNTTVQRRVFYNGELIRPTRLNPSKEVRLPSEVITGVAPMLGETAIMVRLKLPRPMPEDEGVYEVQLFVDISRLPTPNCLDYTDFVRTSDGLDLPIVLVGSATLYVRQQDPPQVMVEATKQVLTSADSTEPLPKLTCSVMEDDRLPVKQLRWTKDGQVLAEVQDSGILAFDTATNPIEVSSLGLYTCEAMLASQIEAENSILIAERVNFMMELEPINDTQCLDLSEETLQLMLDMLLEEMLFSFSYETEADFTTENFARSSITCSSDGSSIIISTDVIYSNSDGSITASALVETAEEWMNGIRTANGGTFQITRPGTTQSLRRVDTGQMIAIILSTFSFGVIVIGITILITCCIAIKQRKHSKKPKLDQMHKPNPIALPERESVVDNSTATMNHALHQSEGSTQVLPTRMAHYDRLVEDSRSVPLLLNTTGGPPDLIPPAFSISVHNPLTYGAPNNNTHSRGTPLPNVQGTNEDDEVMYSSLSVTENYAYNRRQDISGLDHAHLQSKNQPGQNMDNDRIFFNQRQRSVHHYDYPTVNKGDLCEGETDSMGYQSVNDMVKE